MKNLVLANTLFIIRSSFLFIGFNCLILYCTPYGVDGSMKKIYDMPRHGIAHGTLVRGTMANKLGILILSFIVLLIAVGLLSSFFAGMVDARNLMLVSSAMQNVLCFMLPAWLAAFLCSNSASSYLGLGDSMRWRQLGGVVLIMIAMTPAMNALVEWNESLHLPASMRALEEVMRTMEENAAALTDALLGDSSVWGLLSGVFVVGVLTGLGEEAFFRAGIQKALTSGGMNHHLAIWITAFVFSAIHLQFFGFFPRLILGALFGYLYWDSKSLWVPATAHALNNASVVVTTWLSARGIVDADFGSVGVGSLWTIAGSVCVTAGFTILFWNSLVKSSWPKKVISRKTNCER